VSAPHSRATTPVVGVALLVAVTVVAAAAVGSAVLAVDRPDAPPRTALSLSADAGTDRIALRHEGGAALEVASLRVQVRVDGEPLAHQPPVPFFATTGFESGPTGPFNVATRDRWTAGEVAAVRLAGTNDPQLTPGATVRVRVYADGQQVADLTATA